MSTDASDDGTHPDIPEQQWTNPFPEDHPLHDFFGNRVRNNSDAITLVDDYHARRATGKTVACLQLANGMNQHGTITKDHVTISSEEARNAYTDLPERSSIVLDEGEIGASNRDAITKTNKALREIMSAGRVEQKYVFVNTPSIGFIDKDIRLLSDLWIIMLSKGVGLVHFMKRQPYANQATGKLLTEKKAIIHFRDIKRGTQLREVYNYLTQEKRKRNRGGDGGSFITMAEHEEEVERAVRKAKKEQRDLDIAAFYNHPEHNESPHVTQRSIAESLGLTQPHVGTILKEQSD